MSRHFDPSCIAVLVTALVIGCGDAAGGQATSAGETQSVERTVETSPAEQPGAERGTGPSDVTAAPAAPDRPGVIDPDTRERLQHLTEGRIVRARPISKRSLSLKLALADGPNDAFKPVLRDNRAARFEVAAFHVSRLLGLSFVPPSVMRRIPIDNFEWMLGDDHSELERTVREQAYIDDRGGVWGAAIAWIDGLEPTGLDDPGGPKLLARLLAIDGPAVEREPLVAEASALVVFDYVTGNWDRFSGGNLFREAGSGRLVLLDNNGAFGRWSEVKQQRMDGLLGLAHRFSRRLIADLRSLTAADIERALARERWDGTRRLLTRRELAAMLARRDAVIARVDELIAAHGESRVLALP
jgi:hypothetical protein